MSSPSGGSASPCLLETLPVEILEQSYLYSENPSFALVTKQLSQRLSSEVIRLQFYVSLFSIEVGVWIHCIFDKTPGREYNIVLQQPWFSGVFAWKVQFEIIRLGYEQQGLVGPANPCRYFDRSLPQPYWIRNVIGEIPLALLQGGPWDMAKAKYIRGLLNWGANIRPHTPDMGSAAMMDAIHERQYLAVDVLHNTGKVTFNHRHFQLAILRHCERKIVEMIVKSNNNQARPFIDSCDKRI